MPSIDLSPTEQLHFAHLIDRAAAPLSATDRTAFATLVKELVPAILSAEPLPDPWLYSIDVINTLNTLADLVETHMLNSGP